jgi:uncharacterized protein YndB with AHSA1/START domain
MTTADAAAVQREIRIAAKPETVFAFLIDPTKMVLWKGRRATLDPRPGGIYRVEISDRHTARGEYVQIVPNRRVVMTWGWEGDGNSVPPGSSTVEITLVPDGDGTILRLVHRDLPTEARGPHTHGWEHYLDRLTIAASGGNPGPDSFETPPEG